MVKNPDYTFRSRKRIINITEWKRSFKENQDSTNPVKALVIFRGSFQIKGFPMKNIPDIFVPNPFEEFKILHCELMGPEQILDEYTNKTYKIYKAIATDENHSCRSTTYADEWNFIWNDSFIRKNIVKRRFDILLLLFDFLRKEKAFP